MNVSELNRLLKLCFYFITNHAFYIVKIYYFMPHTYFMRVMHKYFNYSKLNLNNVPIHSIVFVKR